MRSQAIDERSPRLRTSCDSCTRSKLRCDQKKPLCGRCRDRDEVCNYSRMGRVGRPPRLSLSAKPVAPSPQSAAHRQAMRNKRAARTPTSYEFYASTNSDQAPESRYEEPETGEQIEVRFGGDNLDHRSTRDGTVDSRGAGSLPTPRPLASHHDGEHGPSWLDHAMKTGPKSKPATSLARSTSPCAGVGGEAFARETDLHTSSFVDHVSASKPTPPGTAPLQDDRSNSMDLELESFMNTDFDFDIDIDVDVDMMMRLDPSAKHHQLPTLPPTSQVEVPTTKPPTSIVGQLEDVWNRVMSGTSELQSIIGAAISERGYSSSSGSHCSCPNLMGRLQLFASNSRLAKHGCTTKDRAAAGRHPHSRLPLDLLLFLDEVVYQTISAVLACGVCSKEPRMRLTLYLIIDWLADVLRATLETDLLRPSSSHGGLETPIKTTHPGAPFASTASPDKDVSMASKAAVGKREDPADDGVERSWEHETNRLQLGSFRLEGELWQICIRELLKTRLNRLSRTVERTRGSRDGDEHHSRAGCIRSGVTSSSLDRVLVIMTGDVYSKIEFLFGMIELWEA